MVEIGNVEITWSFSAFTVLIYYAITNLAALRLPNEKRLYPPVIAWAGLTACLGLAFFVEREIWDDRIGTYRGRASLARLGAIPSATDITLFPPLALLRH